MGRPKGSDIRERMEHIKRVKSFDGKNYRLVAHESFETKEKAQKEANWYRGMNYKARAVNRGRGKYSIYVRRD